MDSSRAFLRPDAHADERRSGPRRICRVRASVTLPGAAPLPGVTVDIGRDGMSLLLPCPLRDGTACRIVFSVFSGGGIRRLDLDARASNSIFVSDAVRVGFVFGHVMPADAAVLNEFSSYGAKR